MKTLDPGHRYELDWLDVEPGLTAQALEGSGAADLVFVKREGDGYPGNVGRHAGTTLQEVLRACIARVKYVNGQVEDATNDLTLCALREAIYWLEVRAADRHGRKRPDGPWNIEADATCPKCLHIGCKGGCRE